MKTNNFRIKYFKVRKGLMLTLF